MKRLLIGLFTVVCTAAFACGLAACGDGAGGHNHNWSETYDGHDDTNHWYTCSGCDEHTGTEPHVYDDDQDATCNKCDYTRHVHTWEWKHDDEYHWKEMTCEHHSNEQESRGRHNFDPETGLCKDCNFDMKDIHVHEYEWNFDETEHWEQATCHPEHIDEESRAEHEYDPETGLCKCGVYEVETQVYELYAANQTYKGEEADDFATWHAAIKEDNVDHVGFNEAGDAVFYYVKAAASTEPAPTEPAESAVDDGDAGTEEPGEEPVVEYDEVVKYYAPRTVKVNAKTDLGAKLGRVWFIVKVKVNGEYVTLNGSETLDVAMTAIEGDTEGLATLTFTPVWGYSSAEEGNTVEYEIAIAQEEDIPEGQLPRPVPTGCENTGANSEAITVTSASAEITAGAFTFAKGLGVGAAGKISGLSLKAYEYNNAGSVYISPEVEPGLYFLTITGSSDLYVAGSSLYLKIDDGEFLNLTVTKSGNGGSWFIAFEIPEGAKQIIFKRTTGAGKIDLLLEEAKGGTMYADREYKVVVNPASAETKDEYDISNLSAGLYYLTYSGTSTSASNIDVKFGSEEAVKLNTLKSSYFEIKEGMNKLVFEYTGSSCGYILAFKLAKVDSVPENNSFSVKFASDNREVRYIYEPKEAGEYLLGAGSSAGYSNLSVTLAVYGETGTTNILKNSATTYQYREGKFSVEADTTYVLTFTLASSATTFPELNCEIKNITSTAIELDTDFTIKFESDKPNKFFTFTAEDAGMYLIVLSGDSVKGVSFTKDSTTIVSAAASGSLRTGVFMLEEGEECSFIASYDGSSDFPEITAKLIRIDNPTAIEEKTDTTVEFGENVFVKYFSFTPSEASAYLLKLTSETDIHYISVVLYDSTAAQVSSGYAYATDEEDFEFSHTIPANKVEKDATYTLMIIFNDINSHPTVTANISPVLETTSISINSNTCEVTWTKVDNATQYKLYEKIGSGEYKLVGTYEADDKLRYTTTSVETGSYYYRVEAIDGTGRFATSTKEQSASFSGRIKFTVILKVASSFEGYVTLRIRSNAGTNVYGRSTKWIKAGSTFVIFEIPVVGSYPSYSVAFDTDTTPIDEKYETVTSNFYIPKENPITEVELKEKQLITVVFKLPENFEGCDNVNLIVGCRPDNKHTDPKIALRANQSEESFEVWVPVAENNVYYVDFYLRDLPAGYLPKTYKTDTVDAQIQEASGSWYFIVDATCVDDYTITIEILQRSTAEIEFNLPDEFVGGDYRIYFNRQETDEEGGSILVRESDFTATLESGITTKKLEHGVSNSTFTITVTPPSGSGYTVDDLTDLKVVDGKLNVKIVVKQRIAITVDIKTKENMVYSYTTNSYTGKKTYTYTTTVYIRDRETDTNITQMSSVSIKDPTAPVTLYVPATYKDKQLYVSFLNQSLANFEYDDTDITLNGDKATVTVEPVMKKKVTVTVTNTSSIVMSGYPRIAIYRIKDGVCDSISLASDLASWTTTKQKTMTVTLYARYEEGCEYLVTFGSGTFYSRTWYGSNAKLTFTEDVDEYTAAVEFTTTADFTVNYTINLPEGGVTGLNYLALYDAPNHKVTYNSANISLGAAVDRKITGTYKNLTKCEVLNPQLGFSPSTEANKYVVSVDSITFSEDGTSVDIVMTVKNKIKVSVALTVPEDMYSTENTVDKYVYIYVYDSNHKSVGNVTITLNADDTTYTADLYISPLKGDYTVEIRVREGYTCTGGDSLKVNKEDLTGTLTLTATKDAVPGA